MFCPVIISGRAATAYWVLSSYQATCMSWVWLPTSLLKHVGLVMSMSCFPLPFISTHSHRAGNNYQSRAFHAKEIIYTKLWCYKKASCIRRMGAEALGIKKMQVLKLSFPFSCCLDGRRQELIRKQYSEKRAKADRDWARLTCGFDWFGRLWSHGLDTELWCQDWKTNILNKWQGWNCKEVKTDSGNLVPRSPTTQCTQASQEWALEALSSGDRLACW